MADLREFERPIGESTWKNLAGRISIGDLAERYVWYILAAS